MTFGVNALDWTSVTQKMAETFRNEATTSAEVFEPDYLDMQGSTEAGTPIALVDSVQNDDISEWWLVESAEGTQTIYWVVPTQSGWEEADYTEYFNALPSTYTYTLSTMFYAPDVELPLAPEAEAEAQGAAVGSTSVSGETLAELQTAYNALLSGEQEEEEEETTTDDSTGGGLDGILDKLSSSMETLKTYGVPAIGVVAAVGVVALFWSRGSKKSKDKTTIGELLSATVDIKDD